MFPLEVICFENMEYRTLKKTRILCYIYSPLKKKTTKEITSNAHAKKIRITCKSSYGTILQVILGGIALNRPGFAGTQHLSKNPETKRKLQLIFFQSGIFYLLDRKITVQSKINSPLKREHLLSQHIKFNYFWQLTPGDVKYPIQHPKWTKKICPHRYYIKRLLYCHVKMQLQKAVQCDWILRSSYHFYVFDRLARNEQHARYKKNLVHERSFPL